MVVFPVALVFALIIGRYNRFFLAKACCVAFASAALIAPFAGSAAAQTTWTGTTSTDWTVGTNWSGGVPTAGVVNITTLSPNPTVLGVNGPATGATGNLFVSSAVGGSASLTIQNGSTLTSSGGSIRIGSATTSVGTVTVTGPGSLWTATAGQLIVGFAGTGILNIENGGQVTAQNGVRVASTAAGSGTVNITGGGVLATTSLTRGTASGRVNFDDATLRALAGNATFFNGFTVSQLNIAGGGLTFDTNGFSIGALGFSGVGGLSVTGGGTFNLAAISTYTGDTLIDAGSTLALTGIGSIDTSKRVVADGAFDISGLTGAGTSIQSLAGSGDVALGAKDLTITNANDLFSGIISGGGGLTVSGGTETLSGANNYTGATTVAGGILRAAAANTFSGASTFSVLSGGTLDLAGFNQTLASLGNAGTVNLGGAPGTVLTIAGNYAGNGGTLQINSTLGGDGSPTDQLVVNGNTSGTSNLRVANVGGGGAQTVEGIKVIQVDGASNGAFSLLGNYVFHGEQAVIGGAYAYTLQKNGVTDPADGDWYLRSSLINPPPSTPEGPLFAPTVPLYEVYSQVLLGLNDLPTLQQRVGNRSWNGTGSGDVTGIPGAWGRIVGTHNAYDANHSTTGANYDADEFKLQTGADGIVLDSSSGRLLGGLNFQYGTAHADVRSFYGDGRINAEGYGLGSTLTWYGAGGFYVDGQARATWFDTDLRSDLAGKLADNNGAFGYAFSLESGQRLALNSMWAVIPQAQLVYSNVAFDSFNDPFGARVSSEDGDSLRGRLGLAAEHRNAWRDSLGMSRTSVYGIANLYYEFLNGTAANVAGTPIGTEGDRLWGGLGAGGTYSWADEKFSVYGEVLANTSLESFGDSHSYSLTGGFRVKW